MILWATGWQWRLGTQANRAEETRLARVDLMREAVSAIPRWRFRERERLRQRVRREVLTSGDAAELRRLSAPKLEDAFLCRDQALLVPLTGYRSNACPSSLASG